MRSSLIGFLQKESSTGVLLALATMLAMLFANTPLEPLYNNLKTVTAVLGIGDFLISKPLLLWINDGLMAIFFLMVGMEIKREMVYGSLGEVKAVALPAIAAVGGMAVPALIYAIFNYADANAIQGWAIPSATDIAFALGILSLLGDKVPKELKLFLLTLAIIDDLGAIVIIAIFYTANLSALSLGIALSMLALLAFMNYRGVTNHTAFILVGIILWVAVLKSGVHATLAGVALGLLIPLKNNKSRCNALEHSLHAPVNFFILPIFAFVNTGIDFRNVDAEVFTNTITIGIFFGLFLGKQLGITLFSLAAIKLKLAKLPSGVSKSMIHGVAVLSGIGFTMSLFIGSLAFEDARLAGVLLADERIGILLGSLASGVVGFMVLKRALR